MIPPSGLDRSNSQLDLTSRVQPDLTVQDSPLTATSAADVDARSFLNTLATDLRSSQLKMALAQDGISLTDQSDVGLDLRFETLAEKATYIQTSYADLIAVIFSNIIAYGYGFVVRPDEVGFEQHNVSNSPAESAALQVDVPVAYGGASSTFIASTGITVERWLDLAEGFLPPGKVTL